MKTKRLIRFIGVAAVVAAILAVRYYLNRPTDRIEAQYVTYLFPPAVFPAHRQGNLLKGVGLESLWQRSC